MLRARSAGRAGFRLVLPSGRAIVTVARIANFGAPNGMLLVRAYDDCVQELLNAGYGYSVVDEPRAKTKNLT